jgi:hypothetical protein
MELRKENEEATQNCCDNLITCIRWHMRLSLLGQELIMDSKERIFIFHIR